MAHPTLTPQEYFAIENANREQIRKEVAPAKIVERIVTVTKEASIGLVDSIAYLMFVFFYFMFTGLAILLNREMPKEWLNLLKEGEIKRILHKGEEKKAQNEPNKKPHQAKASKAKHKIVDLELG